MFRCIPRSSNALDIKECLGTSPSTGEFPPCAPTVSGGFGNSSLDLAISSFPTQEELSCLPTCYFDSSSFGASFKNLDSATAAQATLYDMALPEQLQAINQITEALGSEERRTLLYLCGALDPDDSVSGMKEMLTRKVMQHDEGGHLLLRELMVQLRRFDILGRVFKSSQEELPHTQLLPGFRYGVFLKHTCSRSAYPGTSVNLFSYCYRVLMADLSDEMTDEDVSSVKFLFGNRLPREKMEKAKVRQKFVSLKLVKEA